ncbi:MAG: DUF2283 domain-containing protein [Methanobrevibacter sp.]|jgi:uncharacterized protein YuzE|nr:DUF2283 domain-containing protein [Methanobrevibacter sp.]
MNEIRPNKIKINPIDYEYDASVDALMIKVPEYEYEKSVSLNNNVIMDLNKENKFIALEILNASHVLGIVNNKYSLKKIIKIELHIVVTNDRISVNSIFTLPIHNKEVVKETNANIINDINAPVMITNLVTA